MTDNNSSSSSPPSPLPLFANIGKPHNDYELTKIRRIREVISKICFRSRISICKRNESENKI